MGGNDTLKGYIKEELKTRKIPMRRTKGEVHFFKDGDVVIRYPHTTDDKHSPNSYIEAIHPVTYPGHPKPNAVYTKNIDLSNESVSQTRTVDITWEQPIGFCELPFDHIPDALTAAGFAASKHFRLSHYGLIRQGCDDNLPYFVIPKDKVQEFDPDADYILLKVKKSAQFETTRIDDEIQIQAHDSYPDEPDEEEINEGSRIIALKVSNVMPGVNGASFDRQQLAERIPGLDMDGVEILGNNNGQISPFKSKAVKQYMIVEFSTDDRGPKLKSGDSIEKWSGELDDIEFGETDSSGHYYGIGIVPEGYIKRIEAKGRLVVSPNNPNIFHDTGQATITYREETTRELHSASVEEVRGGRKIEVRKHKFGSIISGSYYNNIYDADKANLPFTIGPEPEDNRIRPGSITRRIETSDNPGPQRHPA